MNNSRDSRLTQSILTISVDWWPQQQHDSKGIDSSFFTSSIYCLRVSVIVIPELRLGRPRCLEKLRQCYGFEESEIFMSWHFSKSSRGSLTSWTNRIAGKVWFRDRCWGTWWEALVAMSPWSHFANIFDVSQEWGKSCFARSTTRDDVHTGEHCRCSILVLMSYFRGKVWFFPTQKFSNVMSALRRGRSTSSHITLPSLVSPLDQESGSCTEVLHANTSVKDHGPILR